MKKECVFKCWAQSEWWYVYKVDFRTFGVRYRVYKGRKWYEHSDFMLLQYAICATVNAVTVGMDRCYFMVDGEL